MKRSRVLNRPMFNKHNSAYGRGIASNLVTDEQRQRFNYGGRVGLAQGKGIFNFASSDVENIKRLPTGEIDYDWYEQEDLKVPTTWGEKLLPHSISGYDLTGLPSPVAKWPYKFLGGEEGDITKLYGAEEKEKAKFERERKIRERKERLEGPGIWGSGPSKKDKKAALEKGVWADRLTKVHEPGATEADQIDTTTLDVADWTPKEKEEKKRDVALAMAERLIGGSRDKWGSTAQMKNLAGALGDVRKITDKEDIRKDQRKYRAYAEAQKDIAKSLEKGKGYASFQAEGMRPVDALYRSSGIDAVPLPKEKKQRKKAIDQIKSGDVIYDEHDSQWKIMTPDGLITVTVAKVVEANRRGDLAKLKETVNVKEQGR